MNLDLISVVIFGLVLLIIMRLNKKNVELQKILFPLLYFVLYRAKWGLKFMDRISKKAPKFWRFLEYVSIIVGFAGMIFISVFLIKGVYQFLFLAQPSPVNLLLPGIKTGVPGIPVMSFWHWIIAIFILATVHETSHGIFARLNKLKLKASGFAIFGIILPLIPAAFVEPDEKQLNKAKTKAQLSVLSAGSFSNMITAVIAFLILSFAITPGIASAMESNGVMIISLEEEYPIASSGIVPGEQILTLNGEKIGGITGFVEKIKGVSPGENINLITDNGSYEILVSEHPDNSSKGYLGIQTMPYRNQGLFKTLEWIWQLFFWLFIANLGVGLFNLLPMGPLDGGRMFFLTTTKITKNEKASKTIFLIVSLFFLALILVALLLPPIKTYLLPLFL